MIAPSISFDTSQEPPIWRHLSLDALKELIRNDVAELNRYLSLQAEADSRRTGDLSVVKDYTYRTQITAWERTQDVHWSWLKEMQDARTGAAQGFEALGPQHVDAGN